MNICFVTQQWFQSQAGLGAVLDMNLAATSCHSTTVLYTRAISCLHALYWVTETKYLEKQFTIIASNSPSSEQLFKHTERAHADLKAVPSLKSNISNSSLHSTNVQSFPAYEKVPFLEGVLKYSNKTCFA